MRGTKRQSFPSNLNECPGSVPDSVNPRYICSGPELQHYPYAFTNTKGKEDEDNAMYRVGRRRGRDRRDRTSGDPSS